jgi:transcriptional regulator with XRE-family HTH domain
MSVHNRRPPVDAKALGARVTRARELTGLKRAGLAREAGMEVRTLYRVETGEGAPSLSVLTAIATRCGVRLEWLATGQGEPRAPDAAL